MKVTIEASDYIQALTPFRSGCAFTLYVEKYDIKIGYGCYCLINLVTGAKKVFADAIQANGGDPVSLKTFNNEDGVEEIRYKILSAITERCSHCSGTILFRSQ